MKRLSEYVIRFSELNEEEETFNFLLDDTFFKNYESSEWEGGQVEASVRIYRRPDGYTLDFDFRGYLIVSCDRCLEPFPFTVDFSQRLYVKFGQEGKELDDDVEVLARDDNQIDIAGFLYEYLVLSVPVKKVHPSDEAGISGCNIKMIEKLEKHLISEEKKETDPRWDDLKKLLDKN